MKKGLLSILGSSIILASNTVKAEESKIDTYSFDLKKLEVVSVSKKEERLFNAASAVYVITNEQIIRSGATSITEALRLAPGIEVARINANKWAVSTRGFNRQYSNKLLVMIDGKTFYAPLFAGTFWDTLDTNLEDIDRIEVIRGSGGTLWGANAVNGVINIITKSSKYTKGTYVSSSFGNFEKRIFEGRIGSEIEDGFYYRTYAKYHNNASSSRFNSDVDLNDDWHRYNGGIRLDWDKGYNETAFLKLDVQDGHLNQDYILPGISGLVAGGEQYKGLNLVGKLSKQLNDRSEIILNGFAEHTTRNLNVVDVDNTVAELEFQNNIKVGNRNDLSWGLGYRGFINEIDAKNIQGTVYLNYGPEKLNASLYSSFIQNKTKITDNLSLILGSKFEHNYQTDFEYQPNAKLSWEINENNVLWGSLSKSIRIPSVTERGINRVVTTTLFNVGNPAFDSETMISYELGYRTLVTDDITLDSTIFYNNYDDLRTYMNPPNVTVDNAGEANVYGFETSIEYNVTRAFALSGSGTILNNNFSLKSGTQDVAGLFLSDETASPNYQFKVQANYTPTGNIQFDNYLYIVDEINTTPTVNIENYTRFDSRIAWKAAKNLEISLVGQNLLDDKHREFSETIYSTYSEIPRSFYLKLKYNLN